MHSAMVSRFIDPATDAPAPLRSELLSKAREMPPAPSFTTQVPSVRHKNADEVPSDTQNAREKRKFPKVGPLRTAHAVVQGHRRQIGT